MKRIVLFLCLMALLSVGIVTPTFANNHQDTGFTFVMNGMNLQETSLRAKTDSSPVYVYYQSGPSVLKVDVVNANYLVLTSGTGSGYVPVGYKRLVHTHVYESGYTSCRMVNINNPVSGTATGKWSPDSVGSYPYAN